MSLLRSHATARLRHGDPLPLIGYVLADYRRDVPVLLDPQTGGELAASDPRPAFILSSEREATDGHIVRQHWNLKRGMDGGGVGIPVLWNHDRDILLGQWQELEVRTDLEVQGETIGPALMGRAMMDSSDIAQERLRQIRAGILRATSIRWIPGASVRRGELPTDDPHYREPVDGPCGPEEGEVMGTLEEPNRAIEASFVTTPADEMAIATGRLFAGASRAIDAIQRGEAARPADLDRLLAVVGNDKRVRAWVLNTVSADPQTRAWIRSLVKEELAKTSQPQTFFHRFGGQQ